YLATLAKYYDEARKLARLVGQECLRRDGSEYVVVSGGGPGVMEAANRGADDVDAPSIGLSIVLPHEQAPNTYVTPELCFNFHYFAIRKMHFLMRARAIAVFPGGYGTLDELFETLTLIQTDRMARIPVLLFGTEFWRRIIDWEALLEAGTIGEDDLGLFRFVETAEEGWNALRPAA
ncbi:MAG: LOG family protein, partial [Pseudomonadota bacterium]